MRGMSTAPLDPVYCPACRQQIERDADPCPLCGAATSVEARRREAEEAEKKRAYLAAAEREAEKEQRHAYEMEKLAMRAEQEEARKKALYETATGYGICPSCKSANVRPYSYTEGGSGAGQSMACCLGCAFNPIAWLIIPFLQGKKKGGFECKYCSNRWSL